MAGGAQEAPEEGSAVSDSPRSSPVSPAVGGALTPCPSPSSSGKKRHPAEMETSAAELATSWDTISTDLPSPMKMPKVTPRAGLSWSAPASSASKSDSSSSATASCSDSDNESKSSSSSAMDDSLVTLVVPKSPVPTPPPVYERYDVQPRRAVPAPEAVPGTEWWFSTVWPHLSPLFETLPLESESYFTEHLCAGTCPDLLAFKILGITSHCCMGLGEKKKSAQQFIKLNFPTVAHRLFTDNQAFIEGEGTCVMAGGRKGRTVRVAAGRPHTVSGGFPCQPWTKGRAKNGSSMKAGEPSKHPDYEVSMVQFPAYLRARRPGQWFAEEVEDMDRFQIPDQDDTIDAVQTDLWKFCLLCAQLGYAVRSFEADHILFAQVPRARTFLAAALPIYLGLTLVGKMWKSQYRGTQGKIKLHTP